MTRQKSGFQGMRSLLWMMCILGCAGASAEAQQVFYFPHYGDGSGLSMQITMSNSSATPAQGTVEFFDPTGEPQTLPGIDQPTVELMLGAFQTAVLASDGSSDPLKTGFIKASFDTDHVSGLAIFKLASGLEASVLPTLLGNSFSLFAQRGEGLETGVAVFRTQPQDILGSLYDGAGELISSMPLDIEDLQSARSLQELFGEGTPSMLDGSLLLTCANPEDECEFAPLGLRFGGDVLSTVAVNDLTDRTPPPMEPEPNPEVPVEVEQLLRVFEPSGLWQFQYTPGSTPITNLYSFFQLADTSGPDDPEFYELLGVDEDFDLVSVIYSQEFEVFGLLDPQGSFSLVCEFSFASPNTVEGFCQTFNDSGQPVTGVAPMNGSRINVLDLGSASQPRLKQSREYRLQDWAGPKTVRPAIREAFRRLKRPGGR